jgi:hypothetical protein
MMKLNKRVAAAEDFTKVYIGIPWDFEMPPRCDMYGRPYPASSQAK